MRRFVAGGLLVLLLGASPAWGLDELDAEEDISDLLPTTFPIGARARTFAERPWAVLPQVGYGPDTGPVMGAQFSHRDVFDSGTAISTSAVYALNHQQSYSFSVASPHLMDDRLLLMLRGKYYYDPQRFYFGIGNNDIGPDPLATYGFQDAGGALTIGYRVFERVAINFAIGIREVHIGKGDRHDDTPFLQELPDSDELPGIGGGVVNPIALSLVWNTRDDVLRPTHGWRVILKAIHTNKTLFSDFEFTRYALDAGYLRSFNDGRQVLGLRVNGEIIDAPTHEIPFWELCELGGSDTLRGFFPHRFLGKSRVLLNGEARFRLVEFDFYKLWRVRVDGVLFGDGGRVFIDRSDLEDEFHLNSEFVDRVFSDFQYSYGGGFRIALSEALVARIDVGFSNEETGLVYLSFGHTF
ncbi:MAG TPA: BamA/TamA family outer membrane protein [Candidatus Binatia bacterium]|nr:BamA/TamA family outer membrane protein [Candidatus Binatia bacterium]